MNDQDYIREAVELADKGLWRYYKDVKNVHIVDTGIYSINDLPQPIIDALAAQLVRQVDSLEQYAIHSVFGYVSVIAPGEGLVVLATGTGTDRTMNTIKSIVDSKALREE